MLGGSGLSGSLRLCLSLSLRLCLRLSMRRLHLRLRLRLLSLCDLIRSRLLARLRLDYRVFNLRGSAVYKHPQRFYAGANISF